MSKDRKEKKNESELIRFELKIPNSKSFETDLEDDGLFDPDDYYLDPSLFHSHVEAMNVMEILSQFMNLEKDKTELHSYKYKPTNYTKKMNSFKDKIQSLKETYIELGGSADYFNENVTEKLKPNSITLKQSINAHRKEIENELINSFSIVPTRARSIAIAITKFIYKSI